MKRIFGLSCMLLSTTLWADDKVSASAVSPWSQAHLGNLFISLLLVIALIFAFAWMMKKLRGFTITGAQELKVIGGLSLGARERIAVVKVGNVGLILGVTPNQINTLHVLAESDVLLQASTETTPFKEKLALLLKGHLTEVRK